MSGSIVVWSHGETLTWGLGGSDRNCLLALRKVEPTVETPVAQPACKKLRSFNEPEPWGFTCAQREQLSWGNSSSGDNCALGKHEA